MRLSLICVALALASQFSAWTAGTPIATTRVGQGFAYPVYVCAPPGDTQRLFVVEQAGAIRILNLSDGTKTTFMTITGLPAIIPGSERGLLGMAFHPDYATNGLFYVNYTVESPTRHTEIVRYRCVGSPPTSTTGDLTTKLVLLTYNQPEENHNGGWLGFGPDGYLYISSGDGGGGYDQHGTIGNGQDRTTLLGKLLRIDVNSATAPLAYSIPNDNPYKGHATFRGEIFHFGLRNPWRCSFDRLTDDLWIGDVGQGEREEIDFSAAGVKNLNFGWRPREGIIQNTMWPAETPVTPAIAPVTDYHHSVGSCVIGGYVYRGSAIPGLQGTYIYADYTNGKFWSFTYSQPTLDNFEERTSQLNPSPKPIQSPSSFGEDGAGELYICDHSDGEIYKIVPTLQLTTTSPLPATTVGATYSKTLNAANGTPVYTWTLASGSLPAGLGLSMAGVISGTPTTAATSSFTVRVTDGTSASTTAPFNLTVNPAPLIQTASPLPAGNVSTAYSQSFTASGGTPPLAWSVSAGALPDGLTLSAAGVLSGTPTVSNTFNFTVRVTDAANAFVNKAFTVTINNALAIATLSPLPPWTSGIAYSTNLAATGGAPGYTWSTIGGALPTNLVLAASGTISGTPNVTGTFNFTAQVTDSINATASRPYTLVINSPPSITTVSPLPDARVSVLYNQSLSASGGTATLAWILSAGSLPAGLSLSGSGVLSGTPTTEGPATFTVRVTDSPGATTTKQFTLNVTNAPQITSTPVTSANVGTLYNYQVTATGTPTPTFSLLNTPPQGMTINSTSGLISWTPTAAGTVNVTVQAANGNLPNATQPYQIQVTAYGLATRLPVSAYLNMPPTVGGALPTKLSQTGAFSNVAGLTESSGLIPFSVNSPLWSDSASKRRWIALPNNGAPYTSAETIGFAATGNWQYPAGTVLVKHFELSVDDTNPTIKKRLETRLLIADGGGGGYGVTYKWNDAGTDADLLPDGLTENITIATVGGGTRQQQWRYPSRADCLTCHTQNAGFLLGVNTRQLNGDQLYAATGTTDNQLRAWNHIVMFNTTLNEGSIPGFTKLVSVDNVAAPLTDRVRSYLDANCAQCHRPGGAPATFDARYDTPLASQNLINGSVSNNLGVPNAKVIHPGNLTRSLARTRMGIVGLNQMPPLARNVVDTSAIDALTAWISSMAAAPTDLMAASQSESTISLTWTDNGDSETGFAVERGTNGTDFTPIISLPANSTSRLDTGLAPETKYYYRIRSFAPGGDSAVSDVGNATTGAVSPVKIDSFTAISEGAGAALEWLALSEFKNAGFNVWRRDAGGTAASWKRVNATLIPGRITQADPKLYRLYDWVGSGRYEYRLESVDIKGVCEDFAQLATVSVNEYAVEPSEVSQQGFASALESIETARSSARAAFLAQSLVEARQASISGQQDVWTATIRAVDTDGNAVADAADARGAIDRDDAVLSRSLFDLLPAWLRPQDSALRGTLNAAKVVYSDSGVLKIPQSALPKGYNIRSLNVLREGRALPALAVTKDALILYAPGYTDKYTDKDAFFLTQSNSSTPADSQTLAKGLFNKSVSAATSVQEAASVDYHDVYFDFSLRPYDYPPWFSSKYLTDGTSQSFIVNAPGATNTAAVLNVNLFSVTQEKASPDHNVQAFVNGKPVGSVKWDGGGKALELSFKIPAQTLVAGDNTVELLTPAIAGVSSQISFVHSISIQYTQSLRSAESLEIANSAKNKVYEVSGLRTANLWVVAARYSDRSDRAELIPYETQAQGDGTYKARFVASEGGCGKYLVVPAGSERTPLSVASRTVKPVSQKVEYLAVGPRQFALDVQPLLALRNKEGINSAFVDQEDIFDYYGFGRYGPGPIRKAVRALRPDYLLLVGRTTYDYRNYSGLGVDPLCPTFLVSTSFWAQTTSDSKFGFINGAYPEVAVGRLPVNDTTELKGAVSHILNYRGISESGTRVHAVADKPDVELADFGTQLDKMIKAHHPDVTWQENYLARTYLTAAEVTDAMTAAANGGADIILYSGHGNASRLGVAAPRILDVDRVQSWTGNTIFLQATCTANWVAANTPGYKGIASQALTQPQGGIAAGIGTSTYMNPFMATLFMDRLLKNTVKNGVRWGTVLLKTQQWAATQNGSEFYKDLMKSEQLFGDPAMPVHLKTNKSGR